MSRTAYGVASIEKGSINATTGLGESFASVGDILKDTAYLSQSPGNKTQHFAELKTNPIIVITEPGEIKFEFGLIDALADTVVQYMGGTVTNVADAADIWSSPTDVPDIENAFKITTEDGTVFTINRGRVEAMHDLVPTRKGLYQLKVSVTVLQPLIDGVPAMTITDGVVTFTS